MIAINDYTILNCVFISIFIGAIIHLLFGRYNDKKQNKEDKEMLINKIVQLNEKCKEIDEIKKKLKENVENEIMKEKAKSEVEEWNEKK